jgi:hypothetical protein
MRLISPSPSAPGSTPTVRLHQRNGLAAAPTDATPDSHRPADRPDQPRSAGRIKAIPLTEEDSARLRDRLLSEIEELTCEEELDAWSMRSWREANVLASADGARVREAFAARLDQLRTEQSSSEQAAPQRVNPSRQAKATRPSSSCQRSRGSAIGNTCASSSNSRASSAAGSHAIRITSALHKPAGSDKRLVTSSPSRSAGSIIASCIAPERKWNGGRD